MDIQPICVQDRKIAEQVYALQQQAYRVEAELIEFAQLPPLLETIEDLQQSDEIFLGCYVQGELAGLLSFQDKQACIDIHRMVVHPRHFRKGVASTLLTRLMNEYYSKRCIVTAAEKNKPAVALYKRHGFTEKGRKQVAPGLVMLQLEK